MNPENILAGTASLFLALGDRTRLRLLNLMRDREASVSSLMTTLGQSQPLISRHLAYLRNSGIVEARRDGKWIYYKIATDLDQNTERLLGELFKWMEDQDGLRDDRAQYKEAHPATVPLKPQTETPARKTHVPRSQPEPKLAYEPDPEPVEEEPEYSAYTQDEYEPDPEPEIEYRSPHHNELEDFLL